MGKRILDIALSSILLMVLSPVLLVLAIVVALRLGRPVIFKQQRPGLGAKPFFIYKFRTMLELYDADGRPLPDEDRLTSFGRLLRSTSLDELPELWNVLRGDMSLVGPRPLPMAYLSRYTPEQARRHEVRPGVTGPSQVNGRNAISWEEKFAFDIDYVDNHNLLVDLAILAKTVKAIVTRDGITHGDHATMPEFMGTEGREAGS